LELTNKNHESFARAVADGVPGWQAYKTHVSRGKCSKETAEVTASKLLKDGTEVAKRVAEIRALANEVSTQIIKRSQEDMLRGLWEIVETPIAQVDENHPECQEYSVEEIAIGGKRGKLKRGKADEGNEEESPAGVILKTRYKMSNKMDARKLICQINGWLAPQKVDANVTLGVHPDIEEAVLGLLK
jgi:hypothetical protein